jgi:hypothetical protein
MLFAHSRFFASSFAAFALIAGLVCALSMANAQTEVIITQPPTPVTINQPGSPAVLMDGNKIMDAKPATATKPRKPAAPAPAHSYTSRGGVPQSSTEETHLSNGLVCKTEKGQRTCR